MIKTITDAKYSLHILQSGPKKVTWEIFTANAFSACQRVKVNPVSSPNASLSPNMPSPKVKKNNANFVCDIKVSKNETYRVCLTVQGENIIYNGNPRSPETSLLDLKIHLNSVISDACKCTRYFTADIINYYLNNPMAKFQYMRLHPT